MSLNADEVTTSLPEVDLATLAGMRDPFGVLSIYVHVDPRQQAAPRPAWAIAIANGLREVRERARSEGTRAMRQAILDRLESLEPEFSVLLDAREPGRGRALFATVEAGEVRRLALQVPLPNRVVLDEAAYLTPLAAAVDRGRPVGLVAVSLAQARVLEQRMGMVEELMVFQLEPDTSEWREMKGPAAANPALAQQTAPQRDAFERRLEEHRSRLLDSVGSKLEEVATRRSWDRAVVVGDPRLADPLAELLERGVAEVTRVDRTLHGLSASELAAALTAEIDETTRRSHVALVTHARDAALAGGEGAVGLPDVLSALDEGRVEHLLFDELREHRGATTPDGRLVPEGVVPPGIREEELVPESRLTARMLERTLATGGRITPLSQPAAEALTASDGIAALLRW